MMRTLMFLFMLAAGMVGALIGKVWDTEKQLVTCQEEKAAILKFYSEGNGP